MKSNREVVDTFSLLLWHQNEPRLMMVLLTATKRQRKFQGTKDRFSTYKVKFKSQWIET